MTLLYDKAMEFVNGKIDAEQFYNEYIDLRHECMRSGDRDAMTEIDSSMFVMVDHYCPLEFRDNMQEGDFDENQLYQAISVFVRSNSSDEAYAELERMGLIDPIK